MAALARDQHGCRFLQRKFDEGGAAAVETVFEEVLDQLVDLMVDPFGNYLVQKLLDICSDEQRLRMLQAVAQRGGREVSSPRAPCLRLSHMQRSTKRSASGHGAACPRVLAAHELRPKRHVATRAGAARHQGRRHGGRFFVERIERAAAAAAATDDDGGAEGARAGGTGGWRGICRAG